MNLTKQFFKYVSQNIFGLIGTSCYILADTYFIAQAAGTDGSVWVRPPGTPSCRHRARRGRSGFFPTPSSAPA